jgi:hypothetical protein
VAVVGSRQTDPNRTRATQPHTHLQGGREGSIRVAFAHATTFRHCTRRQAIAPNVRVSFMAVLAWYMPDGLLKLRIPQHSPFCEAVGHVTVETTIVERSVELHWCCRKCSREWAVTAYEVPSLEVEKRPTICANRKRVTADCSARASLFKTPAIPYSFS